MKPNPFADHCGGSWRKLSVEQVASPNVEGRCVVSIDRVNMRRVMRRAKEVHAYDDSVKAGKYGHADHLPSVGSSVSRYRDTKNE